MSRWPLVCESCGAEQYVGILYGGVCETCHSRRTREQLAAAGDHPTGQTGLGDFQ